MKQTINFNDFYKAFQDSRPSNFDKAGLEILFNSIEQFEEDTGVETELDVIALCCEFTQASIKEIRDAFCIDISKENPSQEDIDETVMAYLEERTNVCGTCDHGEVVYQNF